MLLGTKHFKSKNRDTKEIWQICCRKYTFMIHFKQVDKVYPIDK
ncbi:hypothetical protein M397_07345 [Staphylococcus aureus S1]|nr:hypothetical protein M397_07345 [Staphylococcus aureus S1]